MECTIETILENHKNEIYNLEKNHLLDREKRQMEFSEKLESSAAELCQMKYLENIEITKRLIFENNLLQFKLKKIMSVSDRLIQKNDQLKRRVIFCYVNSKLIHERKNIYLALKDLENHVDLATLEKIIENLKERILSASFDSLEKQHYPDGEDNVQTSDPKSYQLNQEQIDNK